MDNVIYGINGPVIKVRDTKSFSMLEMVYVGQENIIGEVIGINSDETVIQVYEETQGLAPGDPVYGTGDSMSILLGPGLISNILDGIGRPLDVIKKENGAFIPKGVKSPSVDLKKEYEITLFKKEGDTVNAGDIFASCRETRVITHKCMIPFGMSGTVTKVYKKDLYTADDTVMDISDGKNTYSLTLCQKWPIRTPRPVKKRLSPIMPLITGQRVLDTLFPVSKGGAAAIPGGFGTGKTMTQHQIAKWCDADIIIYVGCGERGNEMTDVLTEFSKLTDPKSGLPLTERTILIANTSNMPVAAREASIYTGVTLAEYYRDMGYHVAVMADSTSRWAEALREISGRLEEIPAEEGFPAYLPSRISAFYERAGFTETLNGSHGSVTLIGAVSPQGSDFSEPVTQNTRRFTRCFWALDKSLAYARHYPAINWTDSYSEYFTELDSWYEENIGSDFPKCRREIIRLLGEENKLMEIVKLIGADVLPDDQKLILETAKVIRVGFLQQNAFHKEDTYVPMQKQLLMMQLILYLYEEARRLIQKAIPISVIMKTGIFEKVIKMKYDIPNDRPDMFNDLKTEITDALSALDTE